MSRSFAPSADRPAAPILDRPPVRRACLFFPVGEGWYGPYRVTLHRAVVPRPSHDVPEDNEEQAIRPR